MRMAYLLHKPSHTCFRLASAKSRKVYAILAWHDVLHSNKTHLLQVEDHMGNERQRVCEALHDTTQEAGIPHIHEPKKPSFKRQETSGSTLHGRQRGLSSCRSLRETRDICNQ